jgi:hypothetical protein
MIRRLAIALIVVTAAFRPALAVEHILRFVSDVTVERNGDLSVTETIRVQAEQHAITHGILRDFPTTYTRTDGSRVVVGFSVQSVTLDGASEPWTMEPMSNGVRVRIGSADKTVAVGQHEFVFATPRPGKSDFSPAMTSSIGTRPGVAGTLRSTWPKRTSGCPTRCLSRRPPFTPDPKARPGKTRRSSRSSPV